MTPVLLVALVGAVCWIRWLVTHRRGWRYTAHMDDDEGRPVSARGRTKDEAQKRLLAIIDRRHDERVAKGWR